jgi:hypothetical protein
MKLGCDENMRTYARSSNVKMEKTVEFVLFANIVTMMKSRKLRRVTWEQM